MQAASTPEIDRVFSLAASAQLAENSRQGSERKNRPLASGFAPLKSQTTQWSKWQISGGTASAPTVYLYDGMRANSNVIEAADSSGNLLAKYIHGGAVDEPLAELFGSTIDYYDADGLGSVTALSNSAGTLTNTYVFDAYGNLSSSTGSVTNRFGFTGREFDSETGLYYYRARHYDSTVGRFLSQDPSWFVDGPNLFAYVRNNPVGYFDPTGHAKLCCRSANVSIATGWARLTSQGNACHCFVRLSDGTTLGGYFKYGLLVPQRNNPSDTNAKQPNCNDMHGKPCETDREAQRNFDAESWGIYGLNGTSNRIAVDISGGIRLPSCAWGQTPPSLPEIPSLPAPPWPLWPGFPDGGIPH